MFLLFQCVYVLGSFREHVGAQQLYSTLRNILVRQRLVEFRDLYKEVNPATSAPQASRRAAAVGERAATAGNERLCYGCNDSISASSWKLFDYSLPRRAESVTRGRAVSHRGWAGEAGGRSRSQAAGLVRYHTEPLRAHSVFDARAQHSPTLPYDEMPYYHAYNDPYGYYWYS